MTLASVDGPVFLSDHDEIETFPLPIPTNNIRRSVPPAVLHDYILYIQYEFSYMLMRIVFFLRSLKNNLIMYCIFK